MSIAFNYLFCLNLHIGELMSILENYTSLQNLVKVACVLILISTASPLNPINKLINC